MLYSNIWLAFKLKYEESLQHILLNVVNVCETAVVMYGLVGQYELYVEIPQTVY